MEQILRHLRDEDGRVTSQIIRDLIDAHGPEQRKMLDLYERYKASVKGVPILRRTFDDANKINRKINNDFFSEIIDTKVGYMMGKPISYMVDKKVANYDVLSDMIADFVTANNLEDMDCEAVKMAAICGYAARLCYIDAEGQERVMNIDPWEVIFVTDRSIDEPQFALRYYTVESVNSKGEAEKLVRVEWYDEKNVTYYIGSNGEFVLDNTEPVNPMPHLFDGVPLVGFVNNEEKLGDCEKVLQLIDGYDRTLSDVNSEIESFRLAYMAFYGTEPTEDTISAAKQTGAFGLPDTDSKVEFITKTMQDGAVENHLNRIEDNILRFAKSVNFGDESFAGNQSGVAQRYKMLALESKCITMERKFTKALRTMFKVLCSAWAKKGIALDYKDLWFGFKRNIPINIADEVEATAKLKGLVSEQTRLSLLSFVDDVDWELEQMAGEQTVDLDKVEDDEVDEVM